MVGVVGGDDEQLVAARAGEAEARDRTGRDGHPTDDLASRGKAGHATGLVQGYPHAALVVEGHPVRDPAELGRREAVHDAVLALPGALGDEDLTAVALAVIEPLPGPVEGQPVAARDPFVENRDLPLARDQQQAARWSRPIVRADRTGEYPAVIVGVDVLEAGHVGEADACIVVRVRG